MAAKYQQGSEITVLPRTVPIYFPLSLCHMTSHRKWNRDTLYDPPASYTLKRLANEQSRKARHAALQPNVSAMHVR